jgi:hypothetical protein
VIQRTDNATRKRRPQVECLLRAVNLPDGPARRWLLRVLTAGEVATSRDVPAAHAAADRRRK